MKLLILAAMTLSPSAFAEHHLSDLMKNRADIDKMVKGIEASSQMTCFTESSVEKTIGSKTTYFVACGPRGASAEGNLVITVDDQNFRQVKTVHFETKD